MLFQKLAIVATLTALVAAQDISQDDIPRQCTQICAQVVTIARDCDARNENDAAETQCICNAPNANTLIPACEACVRQFDVDDNDNDDNDNDNDGIDDNDVRDVLRACNFTIQSSFNPASASAVASGASAASASATASVSGGGNSTPSGTGVRTTSASAAQTTSTAAPQQTQNAAPAMNAAAGMGLGALGFALGML